MSGICSTFNSTTRIELDVLWVFQVEASREAGVQSLRELSAKLQKEYEEKLHEEQQKHREEIENLQVCISLLLLTPHAVLFVDVEHNVCVMQD